MKYEEIPEGYWVLHRLKDHKPLFHAKDLQDIIEEIKKHKRDEIYVQVKFTHCYFGESLIRLWDNPEDEKWNDI